jgi:hypothetical protein
VVLEARMIWARRWDRLWGLWLMTIFVAVPVAAWLQHIHSAAMAGRWLFLVLAALVFPVGVLHGIAIWLDWTG